MLEPACLLALQLILPGFLSQTKLFVLITNCWKIICDIRISGCIITVGTTEKRMRIDAKFERILDTAQNGVSPTKEDSAFLLRFPETSIEVCARLLTVLVCSSAVLKFILSSCKTGAGRPRDQSGPVENAPSDFSNAARRSVTYAIGQARFVGSVSSGVQKFPALQRPPSRLPSAASVRNSDSGCECRVRLFTGGWDGGVSPC